MKHNKVDRDNIDRDKIDRENLIQSPTKFYQHPSEVKTDDRLSKADKVLVLTNWKDSCVHLLESEYEGMGPCSGKVTLEDVDQVLTSLTK